MQHFVSVDKQNIFRLPVGWEFLVDTPGGPLNQVNFKYYDNLVQSCIKLGVHCIIDIHNYARWNGQIIGQGGPSNADFASTWSQLATAYKGDAKVIMGIMNEPHEVQIGPWAETVQAAVTAIRNAGATSQMILLPGQDYCLPHLLSPEISKIELLTFFLSRQRLDLRRRFRLRRLRRRPPQSEQPQW